MTIQSVLEEVDRLEIKISDAPAGAPELASSVQRIGELQSELEKIRSLQGPLVPNGDAPTADEKAATGLAAALQSLLEAANLKR
jgi:hypothetical protein